MEPLNCVAQVNPGRCELWYGAQGHTMDQAAVGRALGLQPDQVTINSLYAGGSFGRRANPHSDYVVEAALIAKEAKGRPVKMVWTREDDMAAGWWRPMYLHAAKAGIGGDGKIQGWHHRVVGQSIFAEMGMGSDVDSTSIEGVNDLHYNVSDLAAELYTTKLGVPIQWWRSVGHTHTAFAVESFMDELAHEAKRDPVAFRLDHLDQDSRYAKVLRLAAEKAGWSNPTPIGHGRGVAVHESFNTVVAEIAEVSIRQDRTIQVHKVVAAVDCGTVVNPDIIRAQVEGAVMYGLSAALHGKVTLTDGKVDQHNFDSYTVLRMNEAPVVEVYVLPSEAPPTGIGEPGTPPIAPAVANAVFALTGARIRELPFTTV
jgi:isoquinoline 1-oxidoreductase beta subunit